MGSETVLLVDDDPDVRACVGELLMTGGFAILEAADGEKALRIAESLRPFEILVTDINMPGIDGLELARRVRALRPAIGVLYMSGVPAHEVAAVDLTGAVFLPKPFDADVLLERVRDVTRRVQVGAQSSPVSPSRTRTGRG
jgi:two-component system, cell cycle sensor histidine kinase and response regulator CckA